MRPSPASSRCAPEAAARATCGGEAPYDTIAVGVPYDLEDHWSQVYPELTEGQAWTPLAPQQPFDPAAAPECGGQSTGGYSLFYCVPEDYVGWDDKDAMPAINAQGGDCALATLLATQWALLLFRGDGDVDRQGAGFWGASACLS